MMRKYRFLLKVLLAFACIDLMGCGKDAPAQNVSVELSDDTALDAFIVEKAEALAEEGPFEAGDIYVDSILYGNFSQLEETEMLAFCKFKNNVHVAGFDRTLAIVFASDTMEVIAYKNFGADEVALRPLPTEKESKILFLGRTTYQDITTQYIGLYDIQDNEWVEIPLDGVVLQEDELCYITDDNRLIVETQWDEQTIYVWDEQTAQFILGTSKAEAPSKEDVLSMRQKVLDGMTEDEIERLKENIKVANQTMERAYLFDDLFGKLSNPSNLYWNYVDQKGEIQIGWALENITDYDASSGLTYEEYAQKYGEPIMAYNRFDADNFIALMEDMRDSLKTEFLRDDFDCLIQNMQAAKETHDVKYMEEIYYILHDMDYFLLRYGIEDVGKYVDDASTVSKYYGVLKVYEDTEKELSGEELWAKYGQEIMERFMTVDLSDTEPLVNTSGEFTTVGILGEIPEYGITMYGYNDEEYSGRGVAIQIGDDVNYFDWEYLFTRCEFPEMYWNDEKKQLQVALNLYSGTGIRAQQLHLLQQYETGTLSDYVFDLQDYSSMIENRLYFDYSYDAEQQILTIYDKNDNSQLVQADVSWLGGSKVESVVAGDVSKFRLGDQIWLEFVPGYRVEGRGAPQYDEMPTLEVQVKQNSLEEGNFDLGEMKRKPDEELLSNPKYMEALQNLEENGVLPDGKFAYAVNNFKDVMLNSNHVALEDVDMDGLEELIISIGGTCAADMVLYVYQYQEDTDGFRRELATLPSMQFYSKFYSNGNVITYASHNNGYSGIDVDFWPYYLYCYDSDADEYRQEVSVYAWERLYQPEIYGGKAFPDNIDKDENGLVYLLYEEEEGEPEILDDTEYAKWYQKQVGDTEQIDITMWEIQEVLKYLNCETDRPANGMIAIQDVDWNAFEAVMNAEEYEALQTYMPLLKGDEKFVWQTEENANAEREPQAVTMDEFRYILNNEMFDTGYEPDELWINFVAVSDLDQDGTKELILELHNIGGRYLILHNEDGTFYGTDRVIRGFLDLQTNGSFIAAGGAAYNYYHQLQFRDGKFEEIELGNLCWDDETEGMVFYIGEEKVDFDTFSEWQNNISSGNVVYYEVKNK